MSVNFIHGAFSIHFGDQKEGINLWKALKTLWNMEVKVDT